MTISDPIADMLTRMRNAISVGHNTVAMPNSTIKSAIAKILREEGYISGFEVVEGEIPAVKVLRIRLKYIGERCERHPVIMGMECISRPGRRVYSGKKEIPWVLSGMGIAIVTTPKGVMTDQRARLLGVGGEVICKVW